MNSVFVKAAKENTGQSLVELVIALGLFAIIAAALGTSALGNLQALERGGQHIKANLLAQEAIAGVQSIRYRDWQELSYERSGVSITGNQWVLDGEGTTEDIDGFTRTINFTRVYRDILGNLVSAAHPEAVLDPNSRLVTVAVSWAIRPGVDKTLAYTTEIINFN